jgi:hypothetical protein
MRWMVGSEMPESSASSADRCRARLARGAHLSRRDHVSTGSGFALAPSLTLGAASYQRSIYFWLAAHGTKEAIFACCISWLWSNPAEPTLFGLRIK